MTRKLQRNEEASREGILDLGHAVDRGEVIAINLGKRDIIWNRLLGYSGKGSGREKPRPAGKRNKNSDNVVARAGWGLAMAG